MPIQKKASKPALKKRAVTSTRAVSVKKAVVKKAVQKGVKSAKQVSVAKKSPPNKTPVTKSKAVVAKKITIAPKKAIKTASSKIAAKKVGVQKPVLKKQAAEKTTFKKSAVKNTHLPKKKPTTSSTPVKKSAPTPDKKTPSHTVAKISDTAKKSAAKHSLPIQKRNKRPGTTGPEGFSPYEIAKGEEYMSDAQLLHFQRILNLWKEQLYADRDATTKHMRDDTVNFPDPLDRAAMEEEHALEWSAREREHRLILKIDQSLATIKQGDYGYCESCGAEIGIRRLEARPTATQCIDCKTIAEIREKHTGI